jgi:hypothetical protein
MFMLKVIIDDIVVVVVVVVVAPIVFIHIIAIYVVDVDCDVDVDAPNQSAFDDDYNTFVIYRFCC